MSLKIINFRSQLHLPGSNELTHELLSLCVYIYIGPRPGYPCVCWSPKPLAGTELTTNLEIPLQNSRNNDELKQIFPNEIALFKITDEISMHLGS